MTTYFDIEQVLNKLKFGESVLIEYNSLTHPEFWLFLLVQWAKKKGYKIVIDDNIDTLYSFKASLELLGLDTKVLEEALVIKTGGRKKVGNIIGEIPINDVRVESSKYVNFFVSAIGGGNVINPVLGLDRAFYIHSSKEEVMALIRNGILFKGDKRRIAFYFVNIDVLNNIHPAILSWLEELVTTIIRIQQSLKEMRALIVKSINHELNGEEVIVPFMTKNRSEPTLSEKGYP
ncbi:hypothetical protein E3E22_01790 [Thermococcus sp. MV5]|uniref:DUF257 family protein n=1 Tax=Thermococcus sp. MV5 TaxID=1638272 RepID=UPI00143BE7FE|nr:DUF257 family protein [Thermococcus sp. MV5]NJE25381.1 hypothetical protein [Thermococcus sp. MV5]